MADENQKPTDGACDFKFSCSTHSDLMHLAEISDINQSSASAVTTTTALCCPSKRKRHLNIEIPKVLREIQKDNPTENNAGGFDGAGVAVFSRKGRKKFMEDTHKIFSHFHGDSKKAFFGVYDGHGGRKAAEFVAENLHKNIFQMLNDCHGEMRKNDAFKASAIKAAYLKTDRDFLKQGLSSGACCVSVLIEEKYLIVSNLGDCRAVLCRSGVAEALTQDHRAGREDERERIEKKGGYVENHRGAWRVHGILTVSRSIGDSHLKDWVMAEPDTRIIPRTHDMEFLVLASDGLWEKVSNQEAIETAMHVCLVESKPKFTVDFQKENEDAFGSESISPPSKFRRICLVNQQRVKLLSPSEKINGNRRTVDTLKENKEELGVKSPLRVSCGKQKKVKTQYPSEESNSNEKTVDPLKENEIDFTCGNHHSSAQKNSFSKRHKANTESPNQESGIYKKQTTSVSLQPACKELVNLAASRGSLDDITVMIIDLTHF